MSYKVYKSQNYFVVHDTTTNEDVIRQVRNLVRWEKKGTLYSFYYNTPNLTTVGNSIIRLGSVYEFSDLVDSTGTAWASQSAFDLYLEQWTGHICCPSTGEYALYNLYNSVPTLLSTGAIPSGSTSDITAPDGIINIKKTGGGTISSQSIPSGATVDYDVADNAITVNGGNDFTIDATDPLDIVLKDTTGATVTPVSVTPNAGQHKVDIVLPAAVAAVAPIGANLLQTGQTVSLSTNDDITRGRATNFTTLSSNNPFGNTNRFTSTTGNQTYSNGIVVDWSTYNGSTVLCYYISDTTFRTWTTQLNQYISSTIGGLNGWHLWNRTECYNLLNPSVTGQMNYAPFNFGGSQRYYFTSTSIDSSVVYADLLGAAIIFQGTTTSNSLLGVWVRYSTVTGTTLS